MMSSTSDPHEMVMSSSVEVDKLSMSDKQISNGLSNLSNLSISDDIHNPSKINLVGGHINQIVIENEDILCKKTKINEVRQYHLIFDESPETKGLVLPKSKVGCPNEQEVLARQRSLY